MIRFAAEAGLQPDRLTPAHDVSLGRLLRGVALLGRLYVEQQEQDKMNLELPSAGAQQ